MPTQSHDGAAYPGLEVTSTTRAFEPRLRRHPVPHPRASSRSTSPVVVSACPGKASLPGAEPFVGTSVSPWYAMAARPANDMWGRPGNLTEPRPSYRTRRAEGRHTASACWAPRPNASLQSGLHGHVTCPGCGPVASSIEKELDARLFQRFSWIFQRSVFVGSECIESCSAVHDLSPPHVAHIPERMLSPANSTG